MSGTLILDIQRVCEDFIPISDETLTQWVQLSLSPNHTLAELTLRLVSRSEITTLNHQYRKKNNATNVLAFPAAHPVDLPLDTPFLGDIVICPAVLNEESVHLNQSLVAHWAHIVIHGVLHLLGYDHINEDDEKRMQAYEIQLLATLGFDNPYEIEASEIE